MQELTEEERRTLNQLARESLILKILKDVAFDMNACKLEGWNHMELPIRIRDEMNAIIERRGHVSKQE